MSDRSNNPKKTRKRGFSGTATFASLAIVAAIVAAGVSVVKDPVQAALGFQAQTQVVAGYGLPVDEAGLEALGINVDDYTLEELSEMFADDQAIGQAAIREKLQGEMQVNEYGQTYGSALAGDSNTGEGIPDLIEVVATNGKTGYVYAEEIRNQRNAMDAMSPDQHAELDSTQGEERRQVRDETLQRDLKELFGVELVTLDEAKEVMGLTPQPDGMEIARAKLNEIVAARIRANRDVNGNTIKAGANEQQVLEYISAKYDPSSLEWMSLDEPVPFYEFYLLHQSANNAAGTKFPVYESDGRTQIGEYVIWEYN